MPPFVPRRIRRVSTNRQFSGRRRYTSYPGADPYPWKAPPPRDAVDFSGPGWVPAAGSSEHVDSIRLIYGEDAAPRLRSTQVGTLLEQGNKPSETILQVRFRDGGWAVYWTDDGHTWVRLETIYHLMESADHPGEIIWSHLIMEHWPYDASA